MIDQTTEEAPGKAGIALLRKVTPVAWLQQPAYDFSVFKQGERKGESDHRPHDFNWHPELFEGPGLHKYDKNAMYVGAASNAVLGVGAPVHQRGPELSKRPGLWHVHIEAAPPAIDALPPLVEDADSWQYTPIVELLVKIGYRLRIEDAYIWSAGHQVLRPFYEEIKAMRAGAAGDAATLKRVKDIYRVTFGMLAHERPGARPGYLFRPDWFFCLVATAKVIMYRQIQKILDEEGQAPVAVYTDALYYAAPVQGLPIGQGIGQFKYKLCDQADQAGKIEGKAAREAE